MIPIVYWLVVLLSAAFCLRLVCGLLREDLPSWRQSIVSVLMVTFVSYLAFDFTAYLIMRSMDGVLLHVPPGYGYELWFRAPLPMKLHIIGHAGPVRYLPYVFALCAAGFFQVIALQAQVTFRKGLLIALLQTAGLALSAYVASLVFGVALHPPGGNEAPAVASTDQNSPAMIESQVKDAVAASSVYLQNAGKGLKTYADSHLEDLKEELEPLTRRLPQPVQDFLEDGGWWIVLGVLTLIAILWARSLVSKLRQAGRKAKRKAKKKKPGSKAVPLKLTEDLSSIGDAYTDEPDQRLLVKGLPARLRLVILSQGNKNPGGLREEMVDRVLDWIRQGLAKAAADDYPRVRIWPPFYDAAGFARNVAKNVVPPEGKGMRSHWIVVTGRVEMGLSIINVGLAFYTDEMSTVRNIAIQGDRWLDALAIESGREMAGSR